VRSESLYRPLLISLADFIEQGPIVQIKSAGRKKEVLYDRDKKIEWGR
jgi:hypothetical protein